jgi:hypothetical protein
MTTASTAPLKTTAAEVRPALEKTRGEAGLRTRRWFA